MTKIFCPFEEAREFVRALNLKGQKEWNEYCKSGNKPDNIPTYPNKTYKNKFKGVANWLGTEWRPFKEAREFVRALNLKGQKEWNEYCKSGNKPDNIPANPNRTYKNKGYVNLGDWLGTNRR
jgi:exonuclease I